MINIKKINIKNNIYYFLKKNIKKMKKNIINLKINISKIFSNKINIGIISNLKVNYLGSSINLKKISNLLLINNNTINIKPYEKHTIKNIEKSIKKSNFEFNPIILKDSINVEIPKLNYEKRLTIIKIIKNEIENFKIKIRNIRNEINNFIKNDKLSQDEKYNLKKYIQKKTNKYIKNINNIFKKKKKEILIK